MCQKYCIVFLVFVTILTGCSQPEQGLSPFDLLAEEGIQSPNPPDNPVPGPAFQIIPDSELVFGTSTVDFSFEGIDTLDGYLASCSEIVNEKVMTGKEIVEQVSRDYSINPRLLLALLDFCSGWISHHGDADNSAFPIFRWNDSQPGLFRQLSWAANELNRGFYASRVGALENLTLDDGTQVIISKQVNGASAAIQYLFALMMGFHEWQIAVGPLGLYARYLSLFGNPSAPAMEILIPDGLIQPSLRLPFEYGTDWFFTSGPHSAWGDGAAWGALDFAPDEGQFGCYDSNAWVLAAADGMILRSENGAVVQELDKDGQEGTGWIILYMHIAENDRVKPDSILKTGDRIGHPSCEGGPATGTHLHIARRYNGEWIPADQNLLFILDGWTSSGDGLEYGGHLSRDGETITALGYPSDENKIRR